MIFNIFQIMLVNIGVLDIILFVKNEIKLIEVILFEEMFFEMI
jgi:hypothetical protein